MRFPKCCTLACSPVYSLLGSCRRDSWCSLASCNSFSLHNPPDIFPPLIVSHAISTVRDRFRRFGCITRFRLSRARTDNVAAFMVFSNTVLGELVRSVHAVQCNCWPLRYGGPELVAITQRKQSTYSLCRHLLSYAYLAGAGTAPYAPRVAGGQGYGAKESRGLR